VTSPSKSALPLTLSELPLRLGSVEITFDVPFKPQYIPFEVLLGIVTVPVVNVSIESPIIVLL
jgi:hypothetical protein